MIFDNISNLNVYFKGAWITEVTKFFKTLTVSTPNRVYPLAGDQLFLQSTGLSYQNRKLDYRISPKICRYSNLVAWKRVDRNI